MDINNLNQADVIYKTSKTDAERERLAAFKAVAKQEKNFAELIKQQAKTNVSIKNLFDKRVGEKIITVYDKDGNVLFKKFQVISSANTFEYDKRYYEYTDKKTGNQVFFADFDNDGKMDYIRIMHGDKVIIEGQDIDDDGTFDEIKMTNIQNNSDKVFSAKKKIKL